MTVFFVLYSLSLEAHSVSQCCVYWRLTLLLYSLEFVEIELGGDGGLAIVQFI